MTSSSANAITNTNFLNTIGTRSSISWLKSSGPAVNPVTLASAPETSPTVVGHPVAQVPERRIGGVVRSVSRDRNFDDTRQSETNIDRERLLEQVQTARLGA